MKLFSRFNDPIDDDCVEIMINGVVGLEDDREVFSRVIVVVKGIVVVVVVVEEKVVVDVTVVVEWVVDVVVVVVVVVDVVVV